jgi:glycerol-3-phosphate acyltransferase PlsY
MELPRAVSMMLLAYLLGSIPFSFLVARLRGVDLRAAGSGNIGAANVWRTCGPLAGTAAFVGDLLKGALPVALADRLGLPEPFLVLVGGGAVLGHVRPLFLRFRGGKAVATAGGVLLALSPPLAAVGVATWAVVFAASRIAAVASLSVAVLVPIAAVVGFLLSVVRPAALLAALLAAPLVIVLHRSNIARLRRGDEHRFR